MIITIFKNEIKICNRLKLFETFRPRGQDLDSAATIDLEVENNTDLNTIRNLETNQPMST